MASQLDRSHPRTAAGRWPVMQELRRRPLLADGAMGTELYRLSGHIPGCFDAFNLHRRDLVEQVHLEYLRAGADLIQTNTFGATAPRLESYGLADKVWEINVWGVKLARQAREIAGEPAWVAGSIGPLGRLAQGAMDEDEAVAVYCRQVEGLLAGGVDLFIIETMSDPREALCALRAVRSLSDLPVIVQFSFSTEGHTTASLTPADIARHIASLEEFRPEGLGVNCGSGPAAVLGALQELRTHMDFDGVWSAQPNAGLPTRVAGRLMYEASPRYFAEFVPRFLQAGVRLIGGCCGTTPAHVAAMCQALDAILQAGGSAAEGSAAPGSATAAESSSPAGARGDSDAGFPGVSLLGRGPAAPGVLEDEEGSPRAGDQPRMAAALRATAASPAGAAGADPATGRLRIAVGRHEPQAALEQGRLSPLAGRAAFAQKLGREFVVSVELDPPRGPVARKFLQGAAALGEAGVDAINVADSPMARVRMSAIVGAYLIQAVAGVEAIVHFTARDRNLMGIQSDLLGAHALGLRNVLALTGDPPSLGDYVHATGVYDVDSIGLIRILRELNAGRDSGGHPIAHPTQFTIGAALSPCAQDLATELKRLQAKLEAGAHFIMTQPLYELQPLREVFQRIGELPVPVLLGVMPLHSAKHAEYLHNEVPGIQIPAPIREALHKAGPDGFRVGMELAAEIIQEARESGLVQGVYLVPSFGKYDGVVQLVRDLKQRRDAPGKQASFEGWLSV